MPDGAGYPKYLDVGDPATLASSEVQGPPSYVGQAVTVSLGVEDAEGPDAEALVVVGSAARVGGGESAVASAGEEVDPSATDAAGADGPAGAEGSVAAV